MIPFWRKEPSSWWFAFGLAAISCLFFACVPLAIKGVNWNGLDFNQKLLPITGVKSLTTAILIIMLIGIKNFELKISSKDQIYAIASRIFVNIAWVCVLSMSMPSGTSVFIFFIYPFIVLTISWRNVEQRDFLYMIISTLGVAICVSSEIRSSGYLGIGISLFAALANGTYIHFISKLKTSNEKLSSFIWTELACSFFALPLLWIEKSPSISGYCGMILSGYLMALGMFMLLKSLSKLKGHESSQILLLQPLLTLIIGVLVLGEVIYFSVYLGGLMIILGCFLRFLPKKTDVI